MSLKHILLGCSATVLSLGIATSATAFSIDNPTLEVEPLVIVWAADEATGQTRIAVDFIADDGAGGTVDLIGGSAIDGRTMVTGSLQATADSSFTLPTPGNNRPSPLWRVLDDGALLESFDEETPGTFSAFDVTDSSLEGYRPSMNSAFYVASNTAFGINGQATLVETSGDYQLDDVRWSMAIRVNEAGGGFSFGSRAQSPQGTINPVGNLGAMTSPTTLYTGARKTAASPGTISQQSVRFSMLTQLDIPNARIDLADGYGEIKAEVVYTVYVL
ncbi:MAG: hypothetical protein AAFO74_16430 [Pseudomonadota bacterium]